MRQWYISIQQIKSLIGHLIIWIVKRHLKCCDILVAIESSLRPAKIVERSYVLPSPIYRFIYKHSIIEKFSLPSLTCTQARINIFPAVLLIAVGTISWRVCTMYVSKLHCTQFVTVHSSRHRNLTRTHKTPKKKVGHYKRDPPLNGAPWLFPFTSYESMYMETVHLSPQVRVRQGTHRVYKSSETWAAITNWPQVLLSPHTPALFCRIASTQWSPPPP